MTIPAVSWSALDADAKRGRILTAARDLFARDGLDAPMPALAAALGVGVGSLYRCYPSKHELIAALMIQRLEQIRAVVVAAAPDDDADAWRALCSLLRELAEEQAGDEVFGRADQLVGGDRRVRRAQAPTRAPATCTCCSRRRAPRATSIAPGGSGCSSCSSTRWRSPARAPNKLRAW